MRLPEPRDVAAAAAALSRFGLLRPRLPRPAVLGVVLDAVLAGPSLGLAVAWQAATKPSALALIDDTGVLSWSELDRRVTRLTNALHASASPGERVAFALRNGREAVECYAASGRAGMVAVPLSTWVTAPEVARIVAVQQPAIVVADVEFADAVQEGIAAQSPRPTLLLVGERPGAASYEAALAAAGRTPPLVRASTAIVTHTSGTTGAPRGAERSASPRAAGALAGYLLKVPLRHDDRLLLAPPLFHAFGQGVMAAALIVGATLVLARRFDPAGFDALVHRHGVTAAALVPAMLQQLLEHPGDDPNLRVLLVSGSRLPTTVLAAAEERFGDIVYDLYGSTEVGWATISTPEDRRRKPGTVGRPGPGMRVVAVGADGTPLAAGEVGELVATTGLELSGFTGAEPLAASGGVAMGDLGYVDADGYLFVAGRADDLVISGGENVYPSEVEEALEQHPQVVECAVYGVDDERFGQVLHAAVVVAGDVDANALKAWLRGRLARFKVPKRIRLVDELPRNATGKVVVRQLRQRAR